LQCKSENIINKYVHLQGQLYIHTCQGQVLPIVPFTADERAVSGGDRHLSAIIAAVRRFWFNGAQSSPKSEIPCPGHPWTNLQNLTPLVLSWLEKSVTKQTKKQPSKRYIHTLSISMCG